MNIIMNMCILVISLFLTVAVLSCGTAPQEGLLGEEPEEPAVVFIREPVVTGLDNPLAIDRDDSIVVGKLPIHKFIDGKLERGSRVKVTNTIVNGVDKRLPIRGRPGIESPMIGSVANGAIGTILSHPSHGNGLIWWEIAWDDKGKIAFNEGENCCIGWSPETNFAQGIRYLTEIR